MGLESLMDRSTEKIIDNINKLTFGLKNFGGIIHKTFSLYFGVYLWGLKYWTPVYVKNFPPQLQQNLCIKLFYAGAPPRNRGRHFDRRISQRYR